MVAPFSASASCPAKSAFLRLRAIGRMDLKTFLLSISMRPSGKTSFRVKAAQFGFDALDAVLGDRCCSITGDLHQLAASMCPTLRKPIVVPYAVWPDPSAVSGMAITIFALPSSGHCRWISRSGFPAVRTPRLYSWKADDRLFSTDKYGTRTPVVLITPTPQIPDFLFHTTKKTAPEAPFFHVCLPVRPVS